MHTLVLRIACYDFATAMCSLNRCIQVYKHTTRRCVWRAESSRLAAAYAVEWIIYSYMPYHTMGTTHTLPPPVPPALDGEAPQSGARISIMPCPLNYVCTPVPHLYNENVSRTELFKACRCAAAAADASLILAEMYFPRKIFCIRKKLLSDCNIDSPPDCNKEFSQFMLACFLV